MEPLKLTEPHCVFCGTLGFRRTPVEEHCCKCKMCSMLFGKKQLILQLIRFLYLHASAVH